MPEPPKILYHYCGLEALFGIAEKQCLWLSNIFFLNDTLEHRWFRRIVERRLEAYLAERELDLHRCVAANDKKELECAQLNHAFLVRLASSLTRNNEFTNHAITCFSEHSDALSQWRGYGDDGHGFAIGFDATCLQYDPAVRLIQVNYKRDEQEDYARALIDDAFAKRHGDEVAVANVVDKFENDVFEWAARCKNEAFDEEKEWRLIYNPAIKPSEIMFERREGVKFRTRGRDLIPYHRWPLKVAAPYETIRRVVFGPKFLKQEQKEAIESLLTINRFLNIEFVDSELSYR